MTIAKAKKKDEATETHAISMMSIPPDPVGLIEEVGQLQDDADATTKRIRALQAHVKPYADKVRQLAALVSKYAAEKLGSIPTWNSPRREMISSRRWARRGPCVPWSMPSGR
jgi:hypothetical protein